MYELFGSIMSQSYPEMIVIIELAVSKLLLQWVQRRGVKKKYNSSFSVFFESFQISYFLEKGSTAKNIKKKTETFITISLL